MRTLSALVVLIVFGAVPSAGAPASQLALASSFRQITIGPKLVVRRSGTSARSQYHQYRYYGPRQHRQQVSPQSRATPMERVPQVAPPTPRVGR